MKDETERGDIRGNYKKENYKLKKTFRHFNMLVNGSWVVVRLIWILLFEVKKHVELSFRIGTPLYLLFGLFLKTTMTTLLMSSTKRS